MPVPKKFNKQFNSKHLQTQKNVNLYTWKTPCKTLHFKGCFKNDQATGDSRDVEAATAEFLARDNRIDRLDRGSRLRDEHSQLGNFEADGAQHEENEREENFENPSGSHTQAGNVFFVPEGE